MLAAFAASITANTTHAACDDLLPVGRTAATRQRLITTTDLVRIRDIGYPEVMPGQGSPFALSPDGRFLSFVITRADPATNSICSGVVVMPVDGQFAPFIVDRGGALPKLAGVFRGLFITTGLPELVTPKWSPNGRWIAWRKIVDGVVQVIRARADGSGADQVTRSALNVEDFSWSPDGSHIIYLARPGVLESKRQTEIAGLSGWRYDSSILPQESWGPQPWAKDVPQATFAVDVETKAVREATQSERAIASSVPLAEYPPGLVAKGAGGAVAWTAPVSEHPEADKRVWAELPGKERRVCLHEACSGRIRELLWDRGGHSVVFSRGEGWNNEIWTLYRWEPGSDRIMPILKTHDALTGCIAVAEAIVCGRENATMPRRVVALDPKTGRSRTLFDPNPEFTNFKLGSVRRLRWINARGLPAWGDLVLPPDYDGRSKLPMVIVQYRSMGFLRGGIGDDYPIFPMAAKGFAVLSFQRPPSISTLDPNLKSWDDALQAHHENWEERRSVFSSLDRGIDAAIATGSVDPKRIGITGLSDGASTVEFALINSRRFAAAAMSTCCDDGLSSLALGGFAWADQNRRNGLPAFVDDDRDFWRPLSLAVNARLIDTPILMQLADRETLLALPAFTALREAGKNVELIVYPDEYHDKWQPAHRLAVYNRAIGWFEERLQMRNAVFY